MPATHALPLPLPPLLGPSWARAGGNGVVRVVTDRATGQQYACKSIRKVLADASDKKRAGHVDSLRREVGGVCGTLLWRGLLGLERTADTPPRSWVALPCRWRCSGVWPAV